MSWLEGNRKLVFAGLLIVIGAIAALTKTIDWQQFVTFAEYIFGAYVIGNGAEHVANAIEKKNGTSKS